MVGPVHEISELIACGVNDSNKRTCEASGLKFGLSLDLHLYFVYASSEGSGESAHMHRLARACAAR